jgi:hypothetical protein
MGVEFCIWLWRMYRYKQKLERLQRLNPAPKPDVPQDVQPAR